jgi:hypothetical protein
MIAANSEIAERDEVLTRFDRSQLLEVLRANDEVQSQILAKEFIYDDPIPPSTLSPKELRVLISRISVNLDLRNRRRP